jgi:sporulation protein YlmC with PRC-barrel domain
MAQRMDVRVGMDVKSRDGHRLGKVIGLADDAFVVEKGIFYAKDYRVPFRSVETIQGDDILLSLDRDQLQKASLGEVLQAADRLDMGADALSEARMDSAKFQDHDRYDVRTEREKDVEVTPPIGFDPNTPSRY